MFESIIEGKKSEIDKLSERKKSELDYVARIAKEYYASLIKISNPEKRIPIEELERVLFEETMRSIEGIAEYCRSYGVHLYHGDPREYSNKLHKLGWIELYKSQGIEPLCIRPTEKGYELLDGLRKIRDQLPVREANQESKKRLFDYI